MDQETETEPNEAATPITTRLTSTWASAAGVLAISITIAALPLGKLGQFPFSFQLAATLICLSLLPISLRYSIHQRVPTPLFRTLAILWLVFCCAPCAYALMMELFTGHRRPDMRWYDAVWRVYAVLFLWILFSVMNERYIKPFWREHSHQYLGRFFGNSVAVEAQKRNMEDRRIALEAIKSRVAILLRRKKRLLLSSKRKDTEIETIRKAIALKEKAATEDPNGSGGGDTETCLSVLREKETVLVTDAEITKENLEDVEDQLKLRQMEWTDALHVDNYRTFYR